MLTEEINQTSLGPVLQSYSQGGLVLPQGKGLSDVIEILIKDHPRPLEYLSTIHSSLTTEGFRSPFLAESLQIMESFFDL